jgi:hypothetical protein
VVLQAYEIGQFCRAVASTVGMATRHSANGSEIPARRERRALSCARLAVSFPEGAGDIGMSRTQCFALGMVLVALGVAALFQVIHVDPVLRTISIEALGSVSILAAMVFFVCAFR